MSLVHIILWILGVVAMLIVGPMMLLIVWFFWRGDKTDSELPGWYNWLADSKFGKGVQNVTEFYIGIFGG